MGSIKIKMMNHIFLPPHAQKHNYVLRHLCNLYCLWEWLNPVGAHPAITVKKLLKPEGLTLIYILLFYSFTAGFGRAFGTQPEKLQVVPGNLVTGGSR